MGLKVRSGKRARVYTPACGTTVQPDRFMCSRPVSSRSIFYECRRRIIVSSSSTWDRHFQDECL